MSFTIRDYQNSDQQQVATIIAESIACCGIEVDIEHIMRDVAEGRQRYAGDKAIFLVAVMEEQVVGSIAVRPLDEKTAELKRFYVRADRRHRGVGGQLFDQAEEFCRQAGYGVMWLESSRRFVDAQRFYRKRGFVLVDTLENEWEDNIYEKSLSNSQASLTARRLEPAQCHEGGQLVASCEIFAAYGFTPERVTRFLTKALEQGEEIISCHLNDRLVGVLWIQRRAMCGSSGYIKLLAVDPTAQGHGVGRALLEEAERVLRETDPNVFLLVTATNTAAQGFYQRMGYQTIGVLKDFVLAGVDEIIMRKTWGPSRAK